MKRIANITGAMLLTMASGASDDLSLPDPLTTAAGNRVTTTDQWETVRRPGILELFRTHVYGRAPVVAPPSAGPTAFGSK